MRRLADWTRQYDVLSVSATDWPTPASNVVIQYLPGSRRVLLTLGQVVAGGLVVWALVAGNFVLVFFPLMFSFVLFGWRGGSGSLALPEAVLAMAAVRAAEALGEKDGPQRWQIRGGSARALGLGLIDLNSLAVIRADWLGFSRIERERQLIAAAPREVRVYLRPLLTADAHRDEPLEVDTSAYVEGDPWPTLDGENLQWPRLDEGDTDPQHPTP